MMGSQLLIMTRPMYMSDRHCGYCEGKKEDYYALNLMKFDTTNVKLDHSQSTTIGTLSEIMSCKDYDEFINKGFRRSGSFLYKTDMLRNCCRYYTIRTDVSQLKVMKKHRQVVNRFVRAISDGDDDVDDVENNKGRKKGGNKPFDLGVLVEAERKSTRFYTRFESSEFTDDKFQLYKKYQIRVHNDDPDDISESQFDRFLCQNPFHEDEQEGTQEQWDGLNNWTNSSTTKAKRIGPTHECYYYDNKLVAISVTDFLPSGVSSIYFIWDPDYPHLSLGTVSGLRELLMCQRLNLGYYYLGYYIDDCDKMNYKAKFGGEILDVVQQTYFPLDDVKPFMKNGRFFVMGKCDDIKEQELVEKFPIAKSQSNLKDSTNIAELVYDNKATIEEATNAKNELKPLVDLNTKDALPLMIPGVMPLTQLLTILNQPFMQTTFTVTLFKGSTQQFARKTWPQLKNPEKVVVANSIRLFGVQRVERMIIMI